MAESLHITAQRITHSCSEDL